MHRLESSVEKSFASWCKDNDIVCKKMKTSDNRGWPDRMVILSGRTFYIEFKRIGKKPTAYQEYMHRLLRKLGFKVHVIETLEKAQETTLNEIKNTKVTRISKARNKRNG